MKVPKVKKGKKGERGGTDEPCLASWVGAQRVKYRSRAKSPAKKSTLTAAHIEKLEGIGFDWNPYKQTDWDDNFRLLEEFHAKHGNCKVTPDQKKLYSFVRKAGRLRQKLQESGAEGADEVLIERIAKLDSLNFPWVRDCKARWEQRFQELEAYKATHGHCNVLVSYPGGLGTWLCVQRQKYERRRQGQKRGDAITDEQIRKLEGLGAAWTVRLDPAVAWEAKFQELKHFAQEHGHTLVRKRQGKLGDWVRCQRMHYRAKMNGQDSPLTDVRVERLESIGFQWTVQQFGKDTVKKYLQQVDQARRMEWEQTQTAVSVPLGVEENGVPPQDPTHHAIYK